MAQSSSRRGETGLLTGFGLAGGWGWGWMSGSCISAGRAMSAASSRGQTLRAAPVLGRWPSEPASLASLAPNQAVGGGWRRRHGGLHRVQILCAVQVV